METILVIEENHGLREALTETLRFMEYQVVAMSSCQEALALMQNGLGTVDLVISDLVMHDMNAMELHDALLEQQYGGKLLVITSYPMPHTGASLVARPNVAWAKKPIGLQELQLLLAQMTATRPKRTG